MEPKTLKRWLIVAAIAYFVLPFDLIPDFLGFPGRIDDIVAMALLAWFYRNRARQDAGGEGDSANESTGQDHSARPKHAGAFNPYDVLRVAPSASRDELRAAYLARMHEYHPDKVSHLGEALQKLAHEKTQEIERAYRELQR